MRYNEIQSLDEGVTFGQKEMTSMLSKSDGFRMGIEYEFKPSEPQSNDQITELLKKYNLSDSVESVIDEHDAMKEVITRTMSIRDGLSHIRRMFAMLDNEAADTPHYAGMHVSISTIENVNQVNRVKFMVLMAGGYLDTLFPRRKHTNNLRTALVQAIEAADTTSLSDIEEELERDDMLMSVKYSAINMSDYFDSNGRIELRFFGGNDYNKRFDEIKWQVIRAIFILSVSMDGRYDKIYQRELYKLYLESRDNNLDLMSDDDIHPNAISKYLSDAFKSKDKFAKVMRGLPDVINKFSTTRGTQILNILINDYPDSPYTHFVFNKTKDAPLSVYWMEKLHDLIPTGLKDKYRDIFEYRYTKHLMATNKPMEHFNYYFGEISEYRTKTLVEGNMADAFTYLRSFPTDANIETISNRFNDGESFDHSSFMAIREMCQQFKPSNEKSNTPNIILGLLKNIQDGNIVNQLVNLMSQFAYVVVFILMDEEPIFMDSINDEVKVNYLINKLIFSIDMMKKIKLSVVYNETKDDILTLIDLGVNPFIRANYVVEEKYGDIIMEVDVDERIKTAYVEFERQA